MRLALLGLLSAVLLAGCDGGNDTPGSGGTGGIAATVVWPGGSSPLRAGMRPYVTAEPLPTGVAWVRLTASDAGASFTPITATFDALARAGSVPGVPAGSDRILTIEALDSSQATVLYEGQAAGINVSAGSTQSVTVTMALKTTNLAVTTPAATSPYYKNTALTTIAGTCANPGNGDTHTVTLALSGQTDLLQPCTTNAFNFDLSTATGSNWEILFVANDPPYVFTLTQSSTFGGGSKQITWSYVYDDIAPDPVTIATPVAGLTTTAGNNFTVTGTCEDDATVQMTETSPGSGTTTAACVSSAYSITATRSVDATYTFALTQIDRAGNASNPTAPTRQWTRNTALPSTPTIDQGASFSTNTSPQNISGTCIDTPAHTVNLGGAITDTVPCGANAYSFSVGSGFADGAYQFTVSQTRDGTSLTSFNATTTWTLDSTAPAAVTITTPATLFVTTGGSSLTIAGTCESGATVNLTDVTEGLDDDSQTCVASSFSFTVSKGGTQQYVFDLQQIDAAGNLSPTVTQTWDRDPSLPFTPVVTGPGGANPYYGNATSGNITIDVTCILTTHQIVVTGLSIVGGNTIACGSSPETLTVINPGSAGTHVATIRQEVLSPPPSSGDAGFSWIIDTTAPTAPRIDNPPTGTVNSAANQLVISGGATPSLACEDGATVTLSGASSQTTTCSAAGYSFTINKYVDGVYNFAVTQTDRAGNTSTASGVIWTRSTPVVPPPTISVPAQEPFHSTALTALSGSCESGTPHTVLLQGAQAASAPCADSAYSFSLTDPGNDGTYVFVVSQIDDASGVSSASVSRTWITDTVAPNEINLTSPPSNPVITTGDDTLVFSGPCEANATVRLVGDVADGATGSTVLTTTCSVGGEFSLTVTQSSNETYNYTLTQTDLAENVSDPVQQQWLRNNLLPFTPVIVVVGGANPFYSNITGTQDITATCQLGTPHRIVFDGNFGALITCDASPKTITVTNPGVDGTYNYTVTQLDAVDTESGPAVFKWVRDTVRPVTPGISSPFGGSVTAPPPLTIKGTCEPNAVVNLTGDDTLQLNPCPAGGTFTFTVADPGTDGVYSYSILQTDRANNTSLAAATVTWTRQADLTPSPTVTLPATSPFASSSESLTILGGCISGFQVVLSVDDFQSATCVGGSYSFTVTKPGLEEFTYNFDVSQNNGGTPSALVRVVWNKDNTIPIVGFDYTPIDDSGGASNPTIDSLFEFSGTPDVVVFECKLDTAAFSACTSPKVYQGLTGSNVLRIRGRDAAGNLSLEVAHTWTQFTYNTLALYHLDDGVDLADSSFYDLADPTPVNGDLDIHASNPSATGVAHASFGEGRNFVSTLSEFMRTADNAAHSATRTRFTVEAWVRISSEPANGAERVIVGKYDAGQEEWEIRIKRNGGSSKYRLLFNAVVNGSPSPQFSQFILDTVTFPTPFIHVAVTWSRGTVNFYANGKFISSRTIGTANVSLLPDNTGFLKIGTRGSGNFGAVIDEVRLSQGLRYTTGEYTVPTGPFGAD